ncbi:hypothetical protein [Thalassospira sp. TSL5-1]|uniref:hypothetical protein n=1 Tax=Thalassospira sp. TSL5-1 TaxID=1544451 RepID=UPI00093AEBE6|nr:hypothetical protein [Thalassospira sp. TSL5-1]
MTKSQKLITEFEKMAVPHSWLLMSQELHLQANTIFRQKGRTFIVETDVDSNTHQATDTANRTAFLLAGFAIENVIKSFLVYENPNWIANGQLNKALKDHSLTKLSQKSLLLPWRKKGIGLLEVFEEGLNSWARYPCPLYAEQIKVPRFFTASLWSSYNQQMDRYYIEIAKLLSKHWKGPHQFSGSYHSE